MMQVYWVQLQRPHRSQAEGVTAQPPSVSAREPQVRLSVSRIERFFPKGYTVEQMESQILRMLEALERNRMHEGR